MQHYGDRVVFVDARLDPLPKIDKDIIVKKVKSNFISRLAAEIELKRICKRGDILLCFGNLPPVFSNTAKVIVYLQNRYLTKHRNLSGLPFIGQLRIHIERIWLRLCLRDARLLVQTYSMAEEVRLYLKSDPKILPFVAVNNLEYENSDILEGSLNEKSINATVDNYDYVYVASGEPHKNHRQLINAWKYLARASCFPSLCLTLDVRQDKELLRWIFEEARLHQLRVSNHHLSHDQIIILYKHSAALIYPSLFESYGLPLIEARAFGLPIIAAERDYVRDIVCPVELFDPESALSISRAVLRHQKISQVPELPANAEAFISILENMV